MKALVVEDEFASRKVMLKYLSSLSDCDVAINGIEAIEAFKTAHSAKEPYDLVLLDIMMPGIDGQEVLKKIRKYESENGINGSDSAKVVMTTALKDNNNIMEAFRSQCEGYLVKPIKKEQLLEKIRELGFDIAE
jgi:two-component system chemotaxis response regulator CheY